MTSTPLPGGGLGAGLRSVTVRDRMAGLAGGVTVALAVTIMLAPALLVVVISFSGDAFFQFPPSSWGLRQYRALLDDPRWMSSVLLSLRYATTVAVLSTVVVVPVLFVVYRSHLPWRYGLQAAGVTGILIPISAYAVAMYGVFARFGLLGSDVGLVVAHTTIAVPVMLLVTAAAMSRLPVELELAAMVAGATRARAWIGITVRLLVPAILAGAILAFIASFDESVFVVFLTGPGQETLPKAILNSVRIAVSPVVTAIATLLMLATSALMLLALSIAGRNDV